MTKLDRTKKVLRRLARGISSLAIAFFLLMIIGEVYFNSEPLTLEGGMIGAFAIFFTIGIVIAWIKERIGGIILIIGAIAFAIFILFSTGNNRVLASVLISSPFLISGILFYISGLKK